VNFSTKPKYVDIVDDASNTLRVSTDAQEFCDFKKNPNKIKQNFNQSITLKAMIMKSSLEYMEYLLILSKITPVGPSILPVLFIAFAKR